MAAPVIAAGIVAASSLYAANGQNKQNQGLNAVNLAEQRRSNMIREALARRNETRQNAPVYDERGNVVRYVEGVGWVTENTQMTDQLISASDSAELNRLTVDEQYRQQGAAANVKRRSAEGEVADQTLEKIKQEPQYNAEQLGSLILGTQTEGINRGFDASESNALRQALRSGNPNAGRIVSDVGDARGRALAAALTNSKLQGITQAANLNANDQSNQLSLYNTLATRASNTGDQSFRPTTAGASLNNALTNARYGSQNATNTSINATNPVLNTMGAKKSEIPQAMSSIFSAYLGNEQRKEDKAYSESVLNKILTNRQVGNQATQTGGGSNDKYSLFYGE